MTLFSIYNILPNHILIETNYTFVFLSHKPFLKYHLLVSPKREVIMLQDLNNEEYYDFFNVIKKLIKTLNKISNSQTLTIQNGEEAGQTIKHLHMHVIPRLKDDLKDNNEIYRKLDDENRVKLSNEEIENQINFLKKLIN